MRNLNVFSMMSKSSLQFMDLANGTRKRSFQDEASRRPQKRIKTLLEEDSSSNDDHNSSRDAEVGQDKSSSKGHGFTINQEYARRFEHNKKREEQQKCE